MKAALDIAIALIILLFLVLGANFMFNPEGGAAFFGVVPEGVLGLNTLRGDLGGLIPAPTGSGNGRIVDEQQSQSDSGPVAGQGRP